MIRLDEIKDQLIAERESMSAEMRAGLLDEVKQLLYQGQLNGDQKIAQINSVTEVVAEKCQQLDHDVASLGKLLSPGEKGCVMLSVAVASFQFMTVFNLIFVCRAVIFAGRDDYHISEIDNNWQPKTANHWRREE